MSRYIFEVVQAPIDTVWSLVGDFGNVDRWNPLAESCQLVGEGVGAIRIISFKDWAAVERLEKYDDAAFTLGYYILGCDKTDLIGVSATITLSREDASVTRIRWEFDKDLDRPNRDATLDALEANYKIRVGHLRGALGLDA